MRPRHTSSDAATRSGVGGAGQPEGVPVVKLSATPKPLLILGIVIPGIVYLLIFSTVVVALTTGGSSPSPKTTPAPQPTSPTPSPPPPTPSSTPTPTEPSAPAGSVLYALHQLEVADDEPGGYVRNEFGQRWEDVDRNGCDQRNDVLRRDMVNLHTVPGTRGCVLAKGILSLDGDSYTATRVRYKRGSDKIEIDHVVSLADAWRAGAHAWSTSKRQRFANDFMELEAVDAATNEDKGDETAAGWLPDDDDDQCSLVVRQISIKKRYKLTVTQDELEAMDEVLHSPVCDGASIHPVKAKEFRVPEPTPIGEPKPKPTPEPTSKPKPEPEPEPSMPSVRRGVHPGAFCTPEGALGVTSSGTAMICKSTSSDSRNRWRAR
jgi:hypothetical protein